MGRAVKDTNTTQRIGNQVSFFIRILGDCRRSGWMERCESGDAPVQQMYWPWTTWTFLTHDEMAMGGEKPTDRKLKP